jgi:MoxR-like ATPase
MVCQLLEAAKYVKSQVFRMDEAVDIAFACMLSKVPCLFVGNPGTGKSHTFKIIASMFGLRDEDWFYQSITAKTSPEKLFGGIIAEKMLSGIEEYNLAVGAATKFGNIFDELFKSQHPAMMNTLLNYFDENPTIFSGGKNVSPQWEWAFCTTNFEDLSEDLKYDPLWDRMAAKFIINNLSHSDSKQALKQAMSHSSKLKDTPKLTIQDLQKSRELASKTQVDDSLIDCFYQKVLPKLEKYAYISQRKIHSLFVGKPGCPSIIQSLAYMLGGISQDILGYLPYFVWQDPQTLVKMLDEVSKSVTLPVVTTYKQIKLDLESLLDQIKSRQFASYDIAKQKSDMIIEAAKTTASAYSQADKNKLPKDLRNCVKDLTIQIHKEVSAMINNSLDEVEF